MSFDEAEDDLCHRRPRKKASRNIGVAESRRVFVEILSGLK